MTAKSTDIDLSGHTTPARGNADEVRAQHERAGFNRVDGRALRRTGRTVTISHKVKPETAQDIQNLATLNGWGYAETIEKCVEAMVRAQKSGK